MKIKKAIVQSRYIRCDVKDCEVWIMDDNGECWPARHDLGSMRITGWIEVEDGQPEADDAGPDCDR